MIAAMAQYMHGSWDAWLAVNRAHVELDIKVVGWYRLETIQVIPLEEVQHLDCYQHGAEVVLGVEVEYRNRSEAPYLPGRSVFYLGTLSSPRLQSV